MAYQNGSVVIFVIMVAWLRCSEGLQHKVAWSIPPNRDFYSNWSANLFFQIGDTIVFEFQTEFHNVMQISRREFESCTAENSFQAFRVGPATVSLIQEGVCYFICSYANYCVLGQKLYVTVHHPSSKSPPSPPSSPPSSLLPLPPSPWPPALSPAQVIHVQPSPVVAVEPSVSMVSTRSYGVCVCSTHAVGWGCIFCMAVFLVVVL